MKKPTSVRCENCMFYAEARDGTYLCVFNPPILGVGGQAVWVEVKKYWWCGRFKPTDNLTAIEWVTWQKGLEEDAKA